MVVPKPSGMPRAIRYECLAPSRTSIEQKQAEEALRQSNEELQAIYDGMVDGILIADS